MILRFRKCCLCVFNYSCIFFILGLYMLFRSFVFLEMDENEVFWICRLCALGLGVFVGDMFY